MRTYRDLYPRIVAPQNIWGAYHDARRGKRRRPDVATFALYEEEEMVRLSRELGEGTWQPGGYRLFLIREPKRRLIAAASFRDRVVHHAIHRVVAPPLVRRFMPDSFACLPGKGSHRSVLHFQQGLRRHPWLVQLDMKRYFLEIH